MRIYYTEYRTISFLSSPLRGTDSISVISSPPQKSPSYHVVPKLSQNAIVKKMPQILVNLHELAKFPSSPSCKCFLILGLWRRFHKSGLFQLVSLLHSPNPHTPKQTQEENENIPIPSTATQYPSVVPQHPASTLPVTGPGQSPCTLVPCAPLLSTDWSGVAGGGYTCPALPGASSLAQICSCHRCHR